MAAAVLIPFVIGCRVLRQQLVQPLAAYAAVPDSHRRGTSGVDEAGPNTGSRTKVDESC